MNLNNSIPLFVDLDGTIIKEDIGQIAIKKKIRGNFLSVLNIFVRFVLIGKFLKVGIIIHLKKCILINVDHYIVT